MKEDLQLLNWMLKQRELEFKIVEYRGTGDYLPGTKDFAITLFHNGQSYLGRGQATDAYVALAKAVTEGLERIQFRNFQEQNFSGYAAHFNRRQAEINSRLELIERDKFFCHHLTATPFFKIPDSLTFPQGSKREEVRKKLSQFSLELEFFEMKRSEGVYATMALVTGRGLGAIIGLGCAFTFEQSLQKAFHECLISTIAWIDGHHQQALSWSDFLKIERPNGDDHFRLALHPDAYLNIVKSWREKAKSFSGESEQGRLLEQDQQLYPLLQTQSSTSEHFAQIPLSFAFSQASTLQSSFWGLPREEKLNWHRLQTFAEVTQLEINHWPILIG